MIVSQHPQSFKKCKLHYQGFKNSVYELRVYQIWPLLCEIFKSVCAGEDGRIPELKLCSYIFNICPYELARGTWAPRAAWVPWEAQLTGLGAVLLHEQHSSTSTHRRLQDTLPTHSHTQSSPTHLSTLYSRGQTTEHKVHSCTWESAFFKSQTQESADVTMQDHQCETTACTPQLHHIMCSSPLASSPNNIHRPCWFYESQLFRFVKWLPGHAKTTGSQRKLNYLMFWSHAKRTWTLCQYCFSKSL